jgi:hypothetical protein
MSALQKIQCECGSLISASSKYAHKKSQKHAWYVWYEEQKLIRQERQGNERNLVNLVNLVHEHPDFYEYDVEEQAMELRRYESEHKEIEEQKEDWEEREEREREKRSMPRHIVSLVFDKLEKSCVICFEELTLQNIFMTRCGHAMCTSCELTLYGEQRKECPTCRTAYY